ncbi:hypothetical protein [Glycomyces sp. NPDC047010]|uniref:hypothetical protein n=1 Tax=Glycomyces sp. NPDC047010 TaxID=3155023 RepID=UPI0033C8C004
MTWVQSYDEELWETTAILAKHQPVPVFFGLYYRCEASDCREVCGRRGCSTRLAHLEFYGRRATPAEKWKAVDGGYLLSKTEALTVLAPVFQAPAPVPAIPRQRPPAPAERRRVRGTRVPRKPAPRHRNRRVRSGSPLEPVGGVVA